MAPLSHARPKRASHDAQLTLSRRTTWGAGADDRITTASSGVSERQPSRDLRVIAGGVECIAVLLGWQASRGCRLETFYGRLLGLEIRYYPSLRKVPVRVLARALGQHAR